jgi:N utilization substance protein B
MKSRSELREIVMISLYQIYLCESSNIEYDIEKIIKSIIEEPNEFVNNIVYGTQVNKEIIDTTINKYLNNWTVDRLGKTDQAILKMASYELLYTDTPGAVIIDEAIELAKKYSDDKVKNMINGVLDNILKNEVKK